MAQRQHIPQANRRQFLKQSALGSSALALGVWSSRSVAEAVGPNDKLNIGCVGVANRAAANVGGVSSQNIVAICDIDDNYLSKAAGSFPKAQKYNDFRKLLEQKNIDAIVVSTTDHVHAVASVGAMKLGKHVYCEKPLTHTVYEARICAQTAAEQKVATQMGTQIHAGNNYRRVVEIIQSGAIGTVREAHCWVGGSWVGGDRPTQPMPIPKHIHWDLWLGPAPARPYHKAYIPFKWRSWWDFGGGTLGDMGCHHMDLPFWALGLRHPTTISAEGPKPHPESASSGMTVRYEFPALGTRPAVKLTWYHGDRAPRQINGQKVRGAGTIFIGERGMMFADYGSYKLYPEEQFKDFKKPEQTIPNSIGHYNEWIKACKEGTPTTCNFNYSGALTETVLLGNVAFRTGEKLQWDAENLKVTNCEAASLLIRREYRKGWTL